MLETEPSSATWTSRTTSPARCEDRASRGYCGSVRLTRRFSACAGAIQTLWDRAVLGEVGLVGAFFVAVVFVAAGLVVGNGSSIASPSPPSGVGFEGTPLAWSSFTRAGLAGA